MRLRRSRFDWAPSDARSEWWRHRHAILLRRLHNKLCQSGKTANNPQLASFHPTCATGPLLPHREGPALLATTRAGLRRRHRAAGAAVVAMTGVEAAVLAVAEAAEVRMRRSLSVPAPHACSCFSVPGRQPDGARAGLSHTICAIPRLLGLRAPCAD